MNEPNTGRAAPRRRDRAVRDEAWIRAMLREAPTGVLATAHDGQPFVNANLFVYDEAEHVIWMHTAATGRTRSNIDANARVCFTVFAMGRLLPADTALEFSVEYDGVVVFGRGRAVSDPDAARRGLQLLLDKYFPDLRPDRDYRAITDEELRRTAVYRIEIEAWSGKRKVAADDFEGARSWWEGRGAADERRATEGG
jgi:nitroimidazol reductase NimA-like FMN-containing flavoprotein (pyridoxamine 5'-phosphate oxidase superfamily)